MIMECRLKTLQYGRQWRQPPKKQIFSATITCHIFSGWLTKIVHIKIILVHSQLRIQAEFRSTNLPNTKFFKSKFCDFQSSF